MTKNNDKGFQTELIYGIHPVRELLKAKRRKLLTVYTTKPAPKAWGTLEPLLGKGAQVRIVTRQTLNDIAQTTDHQGVVAWAAPFPIRKKAFDPIKHPYLLMLDGIQDPRNLGAIIRSAYCTGISGIIIPAKGSSPLSAAALKASAGLAEHVEIYQPTSPRMALQELKQAGYNLYLATVEHGESATQTIFKEPLCLVIGSEGGGIAPELRAMGTKITLPQRVNDISYNASVAAGILLFLIATKLQKV